MNRIESILHRFRRLLLLANIFLVAAAFTITHLPGEDIPDLHASDKTLHVVGFFGLASAFVLLLAAYRKTRWTRIALSLLVLAAYAAFDEKTQPYFGRTQDIHDWLADMAGATLALIAWESLLAILGKKKGLPAKG